MSSVTFWLVAALVLIVFASLIPKAARIIRSYLRFRGKRLVTCPETQRPAAVEVDAAHAALSASTGLEHLELQRCSRWPERGGCGQECLQQIELAPEGCLVRTIVTQWYAGKACALCGQMIQAVDWMGHKPALLDRDRKTVYWDAIPAEKLPDVFATHAPVCWDCHIAETLLREHPDVVTVRSPKWYP